mmetsp:Transcript_9459/g.28746  ORF Transcript_9459/g.28746 Transcript_9459/m.28746 type:complete len:88 (+) Transcript_9459:79-342(+)
MHRRNMKSVNGQHSRCQFANSSRVWGPAMWNCVNPHYLFAVVLSRASISTDASPSSSIVILEWIANQAAASNMDKSRACGWKPLDGC